MAPAKSKRQSRKRRKPGQPPRAAASQRRDPQTRRRELQADRRVLSDRDARRRDSSLGTFGERPPSPFGGLPVSEIAIFVGAIGAAVGFFGHAPAALLVGLVVCALGVVEFTAREHFSGYRSHAALLAAVPAVVLGIVLVAVIGKGSVRQGLSGPSRSVLLVIVPVFALCFWVLRKRFRTARQARLVRPPAP